MNSFKILCLHLVVICALGANAQIRWLETSHDFGAFNEADGLAKCTFRFVNDGDEAVAIIAARANCGCTTPAYAREAIAPGDTATIEVAYDPIARPGRFTKYVQVSISDQPKPERLTITGVVIGDVTTVGSRYPVDFGPLKLRRGAMMFGKVTKGRLKTSTVEIYNSTADSLRPEFTGMPSYIDVALVPEVIPPGEQATMMAYFRSDKCPLYGMIDENISIIPDVQIADSIYHLPVTAIVEEDLSKLSDKDLQDAPVAELSEPLVDFGVFDHTQSQCSALIKVQNTGKSLLRIHRVYSADPGIYPSLSNGTVKKGKEATIEIVVRPDELPGELLNAKLMVITNDPRNPVQTIRVVGQPK